MDKDKLEERLARLKAPFSEDAFKKGFYWRFMQDVIVEMGFRKSRDSKNQIKEIDRLISSNIRKFKSLKKCKQLEASKCFFKIGQNLNKKIKMFIRKDADGMVRDYYGFPVEMNIVERRENLMGSTKNDYFAKLILGNKESIDRSKHLELILARDEFIIRKFNELRRKKAKSNQKPEAIILKELRDRCSSKIIPSLNTIKQIIYRRKKYVK